MPMVKDPRWAAINFDGTPAAGALLYIYQNGTNILVSAYSDVNMTTPTQMPIIADGRGYFPAFYTAIGTYKVKITTADGMPISEVGNVIVA